MPSKSSNIHRDYVGSFPDLSPNALQLLGPQRHCQGTAPAIRLFLARYHAYPCKIDCEGADLNALFHIPTILQYLKNEFQYDSNNDFISRNFHLRSKQIYVCHRLCDLGNGIMVEMNDSALTKDNENPNKYSPDYSDDHFLTSTDITIYYLPQHDLTIQCMAQNFSKMTVFESKSAILQMVCRNRDGYYLNRINIKKPLITDLALYYGKNFVSIHEKIITNLNKKEGKGIVLLHGLAGSGKTHYIRYLIDEVEDKTLIYVAPDMAKHISSPEFLPFLMDYPDSILIIEDAENIIRDRTETTLNPSQAVANLLNLSDGLLGDAMHMQIIATFNCALTKIDQALLRKGRLIANYEFDKLNVENSKILSEKLGFGMKHISAPMTLAEIYNQEQNNDTTV